MGRMLKIAVILGGVLLLLWMAIPAINGIAEIGDQLTRELP